MSPEYQSGDFLIILSFFHQLILKIEKNVIVKHQELGLLVKKVKSIDKNKEIIQIAGNNSSSTSSKAIGPISYSEIIGFPIIHIKK